MCRTRLNRWGFNKNSSKHRPSNFRDKRPVKSRATLDRIARRLGSETKKAAMQVPDRREETEQPTQGPPGQAPRGSPAPLPVNTPTGAWTAGAESSGHEDAAYRDVSIHDIPYWSTNHIKGGPSKSQGFKSEANSSPYPPIDVEQEYEGTCPYRSGEFKFRLMQNPGS